MNSFIQKDLYISHIALAIYVPLNSGAAVHYNRPYHGLVMNDCSSKKTYTFSDGKVCVLEKGDILYLPQHSNYVVSSQQSGGCYAINFGLTTDERFDPFVVRMNNSKPLIEIFRNAERNWKTRRPGYHYHCTADLVQLLAAIKAEMYSPYTPQNKVAVIAPAIEYIEENYAHETIHITSLAEMCGISDVYFRNIFQRFYGTTPRKYISNLKLSRAKALLLSGEYSVHEVAALCGYSDDCYFSREFKKNTGMAPSDFKRNVIDSQKTP